ncbi:hypothetical protein QJ856_gp0655 [Tupanvirus deep ocean]|uniref:Uncharacterized protein n=2 Tax=Tupanvirus TaxID=2094720 RepID=A0AC62A8W6_9VIRU|nr:hypothetical protein QJ856_gp0655 [Tupanvirus deep ocean]QKU34095.1 hypothetical protein [Tupanvirus deep ocean]
MEINRINKVIIDFSEIDNIINSDKDEANRFFLDLCRYGKNIKTIKYLVDAGIDPRQNDDQAFVNACLSGDFDVISYLVNHCGANVNAQNGKGIINVIGNLSKKSIKLLLENGAILSENIINEAIKNDDMASIEAFIEHGIDPYKIALIYWKYVSRFSCFDIEIMSFLIKNNVDLNQSLSLFLKK